MLQTLSSLSDIRVEIRHIIAKIHSSFPGATSISRAKEKVPMEIVDAERILYVIQDFFSDPEALEIGCRILDIYRYGMSLVDEELSPEDINMTKTQMTKEYTNKIIELCALTNIFQEIGLELPPVNGLELRKQFEEYNHREGIE